jgi:hypothetical protein
LLGERTLSRLLLAAGIGFAFVLAWLLVRFGGPKGNLFAPIGFLAALAVTPMVLRRPALGLYILMAAAVAIETDSLTFGMRATSAIPFFHDLNGVTGIGALWVNPAELLIVVTAVGWLLRDGAGDRINFKPVPLMAPITVFMAAVAFGVIHGLVTGGDVKIALWTVRPLAYFYLTYLLTLQLLTDRRQITVLLWILVAGVALKGVIGWWRYYVDLGSNLNGLSQGTGMNSLMAHEESFFYVGIILLAAVQILYGASRAQRAATLLALPLVLVPFLANQRRAGSLALMVGVVLLCFVTASLLASRRRAILTTLVVAAVVVPFYAAMSWNSTSLASEPVRAVKSGVSPDSRDLSSNEYRDIENLNLVYTVRTSPILGIGFGKEMVEKVPLPDISAQFAWYKIEPHNSILWVMMTTGISGFLLFWYFAGGAIVRMLLVARRLPSNLDKGIAVYGLLMLASSFVFALLDQGLLSMRTMIFVGILLGAVFALPRLAASESDGLETAGSGGVRSE